MAVPHPEDRRRGARPITPGATRVQCLRVARGMTREALAERCGFTVRTIARVLRGASCEVRVLIRVADVLGGDPLELWPELATSPHVLVRPVPVVPDPAPAKRRRCRVA